VGRGSLVHDAIFASVFVFLVLTPAIVGTWAALGSKGALSYAGASLMESPLEVPPLPFVKSSPERPQPIIRKPLRGDETPTQRFAGAPPPLPSGATVRVARPVEIIPVPVSEAEPSPAAASPAPTPPEMTAEARAVLSEFDGAASVAQVFAELDQAPPSGWRVKSAAPPPPAPVEHREETAAAVDPAPAAQPADSPRHYWRYTEVASRPVAEQPQSAAPQMQMQPSAPLQSFAPPEYYAAPAYYSPRSYVAPHLMAPPAVYYVPVYPAMPGMDMLPHHPMQPMIYPAPAPFAYAQPQMPYAYPPAPPQFAPQFAPAPCSCGSCPVHKPAATSQPAAQPAATWPLTVH
jgi:hypothetical protein